MQHGPYVQYESNISLQEEEGHVTKVMVVPVVARKQNGKKDNANNNDNGDHQNVKIVEPKCLKKKNSWKNALNKNLHHSVLSFQLFFYHLISY